MESANRAVIVMSVSMKASIFGPASSASGYMDGGAAAEARGQLGTRQAVGWPRIWTREHGGVDTSKRTSETAWTAEHR